MTMTQKLKLMKKMNERNERRIRWHRTEHKFLWYKARVKHSFQLAMVVAKGVTDVLGMAIGFMLVIYLIPIIGSMWR